MAESAKVRLVRCPGCENLLPELPDYSVYQCGGCGAVLRAKKSDVDGDNEERIRVVSEKPENISEKSEDLQGKETASAVQNEEEEGVSDSDGISETRAETDGKNTKEMAHEEIAESNSTMKKKGMGNGHLQSKVDESKTQVGNANESRRSNRILRLRTSEKGDDFERIRRENLVGPGIPTSSYVGEGTSKNCQDCNRINFVTSKNQNDTTRCNRFDCVEAHREDLLRKLDELKDQLSRTCDVNDRTKETILLGPSILHGEPHADSDELFRDHSLGFRRSSWQFYAPNQHALRPHCFDHDHEPVSLMNHPRGFDGLHGSHMLRRAPPHRPSTHHQHQISHPYLPGPHIGPQLDPFKPQMYNTNLSQFSCSCFQCRDKHPEVSVQIPSSSFCNRRFSHFSNKPTPCHHEIHGVFGPQRYDSRISNPHAVGSYDPQANARWPNKLNLELGGLARSRPQRVVLANGGHRCRPIAGGAPFITCHSCFELLKLPKDIFRLEKSKWRICCGACSSGISLAYVNGKLVYMDTPTKRTRKEARDSSNEVVCEKPYKSCGAMKLESSSSHSEDYDNSGYDFHGLNSSKSEELQNLCSLSPSTSEDEDCLDDLVSRHGMFIAAEMPVKSTFSPPPPSSSLEENLDFPAKNQTVNHCGKGNISSRSDQRSDLRQDSLKKSLATVMEISLNDYSNTGVTQDSMDSIREDDHTGGKRGADSFLAGLIKKSFRDFSRSTQATENGKRNITVNGHLIPDRLVKKAEKLAGPIYPGQYWYDYRAGFWGVMGGPCLGIVPPHIEELNYPMPENCAGGNTGVFVNGRELHRQDLDLLASRGLPVTAERSYLIEISGRVVDEDTGEELDGLGKLAPTVEKVKHGFGMRVPEAAA